MQLVQPSINENMRGQLFFSMSNVTVSLAKGCHGKGITLTSGRLPLDGGAVRWRLN